MSNKWLYFILWITFLISLGLMAIDLMLSKYLTNFIYFYTLTNAVLLYRLIGVYWFTILVHAFTHIGVLITFIVYNKGELLMFINMAMYGTLGLQLLLSVHFVIVRRGRSPDEQACHSGIHAHIGLIVIIIWFWHIGFNKIRLPYSGICTMFYMLVFLAIVLTPHFHGLSKKLWKSSSDPRRNRSPERGSQGSLRSTDLQKKKKYRSASQECRQK